MTLFIGGNPFECSIAREMSFFPDSIENMQHIVHKPNLDCFEHQASLPQLLTFFEFIQSNVRKCKCYIYVAKLLAEAMFSCSECPLSRMIVCDVNM